MIPISMVGKFAVSDLSLRRRFFFVGSNRTLVLAFVVWRDFRLGGRKRGAEYSVVDDGSVDM